MSDEENIFHCFLITFPISIKHRVIKFICIVSGIRRVVLDCVFEGIFVKDNSRDWQEKLTDLVLMKLLFIDIKKYIQETIKLRILV